MYDIEKLRKLLITDGYRIIDDNGKILLPSNPIYKRISEDMDGNPSAKHIYVIAKNNRNGIRDFILAFYGFLSTSMTSHQSDSFEPNVSASKYSNKFELKLSRKDWKAIRPRSILYEDNRTYITLRPGWTDILAKNIWMQFRIPCPWTFKTARGSQQKQIYYCRITAKCTECWAKLICTLANEPEKNDENVIFKCTIKNFVPGYIHEKRRQLRGHTRELVANTLVDTKTDAITYSYVRSQAKKLINFEDSYPPILPKTTVLRKAIAEAKDKRLGLVGTKSINNIINLKHTTHIGSIHKIGAFPFFCHYWTKEQNLLYILHYKNDPQSFMTIDATGSVVKKIKYDYSKSSHIFLYQCMSVSKTGSAPIFQMLSAEQDTIAITTWLLKIISTGVPIPRVTVCDFSQALLIIIHSICS